MSIFRLDNLEWLRIDEPTEDDQAQMLLLDAARDAFGCAAIAGIGSKTPTIYYLNAREGELS